MLSQGGGVGKANQNRLNKAQFSGRVRLSANNLRQVGESATKQTIWKLSRFREALPWDWNSGADWT